MADSNEIALVIRKLGESSPGDKAIGGAIALLNVIPVAGGAVASIIGQVASAKRSRKIVEVLADLNDRLESHKADPLRHLTEDQIIEVVHDTLQTVTTCSDQDKIAKLKTGLGYAFLNDESFERKQLYLQVLRSATSLELAAVSWLYDSDPYATYSGRPGSEQSTTLLGGLITASAAALSESLGYWSAGEVVDGRSAKSLVRYLAESLGTDEQMAAAAARLVDSKGLAAVTEHLDETGPCRVFNWRPHAGAMGVVTAGPLASAVIRPDRKTPVEASRTAFGAAFLRFCRGS